MKILHTIMDILSIVLVVIILVLIFCGQDTTHLILDMIWLKLISVEMYLVEMRGKK